jgi:anti-sigma factor RsiW
MAECRDFESLFAPYVDGETQEGDCAAVDAHLRSCPACRTRVACERAVREALAARRDSFRVGASADLRRRCEAGRAAAGLAPTVRARPWTISRSGWVPLSMAATIVLAFAGVFLYGLRGGPPAFAAQLVADHAKCFQFAPQPTIIPDGRTLSREWSAARGWEVKVPESTEAEHLELLGVRRCLSTEGTTAHIMYKWRGTPLSLYVLNHAYPQIGPVPQVVERFGLETVMWSKGDRTFAVVARGSPADVQHVAKYVQTAAE